MTADSCLMDRNGEVELTAPAMSMGTKRQLGEDLSRGGRIVQLCRQLHVTHGDNDRSPHRLLSDAGGEGQESTASIGVPLLITDGRPCWSWTSVAGECPIR